MLASCDEQISITDPDSLSGRGSGVVGYNVQVAVDTENHLIIAHDVTNSGAQLAKHGQVEGRAAAGIQIGRLLALGVEPSVMSANFAAVCPGSARVAGPC